MSELELPELTQAVLDAATAARILSDIEAAATFRSAIVRRIARSLVPDVPLDLAAARAALEDPSVLALQVRYAYLGEEWVDTLSRIPPGEWRVVRMKAPVAARLPGAVA